MPDSKINFIFDCVLDSDWPLSNRISFTDLQEIQKKGNHYGKVAFHYPWLWNTVKCFNFAKVYPALLIPHTLPGVYELDTHWSEPVENLFNVADKHILNPQNIPQEVINNKSIKVLITMYSESYLQDDKLMAIHNYVNYMKDKISPERIVYMTACANGNKVYKRFCKENNLEPCGIAFDYLPRYFFESSWRCKNDTPYSVTSKEKRFLIFNRRWGNHAQRMFVGPMLEKKNLLDKGYFSFSKYEVDSKKSYLEAAANLSQVYKSIGLIEEDLINFDRKLPLVLDFTDLSVSSLMYNKNNNTDSLYENSFVHVISETYFFSDVIHVTEKSYKPMLNKQPFIMMGVPGALAEIKRQGFKTFDQWWDESYDAETDHAKRLCMIVDLIEEICSWNDDKLLQVMTEMKNTIDFNYSHLKTGFSSLLKRDIVDVYK